MIEKSSVLHFITLYRLPLFLKFILQFLPLVLFIYVHKKSVMAEAIDYSPFLLIGRDISTSELDFIFITW